MWSIYEGHEERWTGLLEVGWLGVGWLLIGGCVSLSGAGFAGFLGDFQDCRGVIDACSEDLFAWDDRVRRKGVTKNATRPGGRPRRVTLQFGGWRSGVSAGGRRWKRLPRQRMELVATGPTLSTTGHE